MNAKNRMKVDSCFKAVIFDMDGTLVNSTEADFLAWKKLFSSYRKNLSFNEYIPMMGIRSAEIVQQFLPVMSEEELQESLAKKLIYFKEIVSEKGIDTIPYARDFVSSLKNAGFPVALATSSRRAKMEMVMRKLNMLQLFDVVITGEDVKNGKPAPEIFLKTAEKLSVSPKDCLVFEDAINGVRSAKNASMKCVVVSTSSSAELKKEADLVIADFNIDFQRLCKELQS